MDFIERLIADNFEVKKNGLQNLQLISSFDFSDRLFDEMSVFLSDEQILELKKSNYQIGLNPLDCIFIYRFTLSGRNITVVIYYYYELYLPTFIWESFEI